VPGSKAKVPFTSHRGITLATREDPYMTAGERTFTGKVMRLGGYSPIAASDRAATSVLNHYRLALANEMRAALEAQGALTDDLALEIGEFVGAATGRGKIGQTLEKFNPLLNQVFFSLRLQAAHVKMPWIMGKGLLPGTEGVVGRMAAAQFAKFLVSGLTILSAIKLSGLADVELDPRSADVGKIKIGSTRIDLWGGFQPYFRFVSRASTGQSKTGAGEIVDAEIDDLTGDFFRSKLAPVPGEIKDYRRGETFTGEPVGDLLSWGETKRLLPELFVPLFIESVIEGYQEQGLLGSALALTEFVGASVQSYTPDYIRIRKLIEEDILAGRYKDIDEQNVPKRRRDLSRYDQDTFDTLHPEEAKKSAEELERRAASGDQTAIAFQAGQEAAQHQFDVIEGLAQQVRDGDIDEEAFRLGVSKVRGDGQAERRIISSLLANAGIEDERPERPGVMQDLYDYGQVFQRHSNAVTEAELDELFKAIDIFRAGLGPMREVALDRNIGMDLKKIPEYRQLQEAQQKRGELADIQRYEGMSLQENEALRDFEDGVEQYRFDRSLEHPTGRTMSITRAIREYAMQEGTPENIVAFARYYRSSTRAQHDINPEYGNFLLDNAATLMPFYPDLYPQYIRERLGRSRRYQ